MKLEPERHHRVVQQATDEILQLAEDMLHPKEEDIGGVIQTPPSIPITEADLDRVVSLAQQLIEQNCMIDWVKIEQILSHRDREVEDIMELPIVPISYKKAA